MTKHCRDALDACPPCSYCEAEFARAQNEIWMALDLNGDGVIGSDEAGLTVSEMADVVANCEPQAPRAGTDPFLSPEMCELYDCVIA